MLPAVRAVEVSIVATAAFLVCAGVSLIVLYGVNRCDCEKAFEIFPDLQIPIHSCEEVYWDHKDCCSITAQENSTKSSIVCPGHSSAGSFSSSANPHGMAGLCLAMLGFIMCLGMLGSWTLFYTRERLKQQFVFYDDDEESISHSEREPSAEEWERVNMEEIRSEQ
eukprot:g60411.t1